MRSSYAGFTLIEVLISLLILSVGLLGVASLQVQSLRNNHSAYMRTQASLLAHDILDRMRVNRNRASAYQIDFSESVTSGTDCEANACSSAQMAVFDLADWKADLAAKLPSGDGRIVAVSANSFQIRVSWDDSRGQDDPLEFSMTAEP